MQPQTQMSTHICIHTHTHTHTHNHSCKHTQRHGSIHIDPNTQTHTLMQTHIRGAWMHEALHSINGWRGLACLINRSNLLPHLFGLTGQKGRGISRLLSSEASLLYHPRAARRNCLPVAPWRQRFVFFSYPDFMNHGENKNPPKTQGGEGDVGSEE